MSYYECDTSAHLTPLPNNRSTGHESSTSDDSEVEVISSIDSDEHEPVSLEPYLHVYSNDDSTDDDTGALPKPSQALHSLVSYSVSDGSADEFDLNQTHDPPSTTVAPLIRSKRRQWSIREKILALATLDTNKNSLF